MFDDILVGDFNSNILPDNKYLSTISGPNTFYSLFSHPSIVSHLLYRHDPFILIFISYSRTSFLCVSSIYQLQLNRRGMFKNQLFQLLNHKRLCFCSNQIIQFQTFFTMIDLLSDYFQRKNQRK